MTLHSRAAVCAVALFVTIASPHPISLHAQQPPVVSAVTAVTYPGGRFAMTAPLKWSERTDAGVTFVYDETGRDSQSVLLTAIGRNAKVQLNVVQNQVIFADGQQPPFVLYQITAASADPIPAQPPTAAPPPPAPPPAPAATPGRTVKSVVLGVGRLRMIGANGWIEVRPDGGTIDYDETSRDDQTITLRDPGNGNVLVVDLQANQFLLTNAQMNRGNINSVVSFSSDDPGPEPVLLSAAPLDANAQVLLTEHNKFRAMHCAPPLKWSAALAATAQTWANGCKFDQNGGAAHDPDPNRPFGENIAQEGRNGSQVVGAWYAEQGTLKRFDFNNPEQGFVRGAAHFSQVVWKASTDLGCGWAKCPNKQFGNVVVVCRYLPSGNVTGSWAANVLPAASACK